MTTCKEFQYKIFYKNEYFVELFLNDLYNTSNHTFVLNINQLKNLYQSLNKMIDNISNNSPYNFSIDLFKKTDTNLYKSLICFNFIKNNNIECKYMFFEKTLFNFEVFINTINTINKKFGIETIDILKKINTKFNNLKINNLANMPDLQYQNTVNFIKNILSQSLISPIIKNLKEINVINQKYFEKFGIYDSNSVALLETFIINDNSHYVMYLSQFDYDTLKYSIYHELGHLILNENNKVWLKYYDSIWTKLYNTGISVTLYGKTSKDEDFCETLAHYLLNKPAQDCYYNNSDIIKQKYDIVKKFINHIQTF